MSAAKIIHLYERFKNFLLFTKLKNGGKDNRKKFPKIEEVLFSKKFQEIFKIISANDLKESSSSDHTQKLENLLAVITVSANYFKNEDGIRAFNDLLAVFIDLLQDFFRHKQQISTLIDENRQLYQKIIELESDLSDMEKHIEISLVETLDQSDSNIETKSKFTDELFQSIQESIFFAIAKK